MTRGRPAAAQSGQAAAAQGGADVAPQKWPVWAICERHAENARGDAGRGQSRARWGGALLADQLTNPGCDLCALFAFRG